MPRLSDTMEEGTVVRWLRAPGDAVRRGEPVVEIETDKATITYEADLDGVIAQILVGEGETVPVGTTIATIQQTAEAPGGGAPGPLPTPGTERPPPLPVPGAQPPPLPTPAAAPPPLPVPDTEPALQPPEPRLTEPASREPTPAQPPLKEPALAETVIEEPPHAEPASPEPELTEPAGDEGGRRTKASPIARRLARKLGIDLASVAGTGPGGRIVKEDVEAAASAQAGGLAEPALAPSARPEPPAEPPAAPPAPTEPAPPPAEPQTGEYQAAEPPAEPPVTIPAQAAATPAVIPPFVSPAPTAPSVPVQAGATGAFAPVQPGPSPVQPGGPPPPMPGPPVIGATATRGQATTVDLSQAQQVVARRMAEAKATVPHFQVEADIDMTAATALREQLRYGIQPAPSINDLIVKACAMALRQFSRVNGAYRDGKFEYYNDVNIGIVVAAGDLLAVPTLLNADQKGLAQIARESRELAAAVRNRQVQPAQMAGGTFTVSNLGMFGVPRFNAIINTPQAGILAVGAIQRKPVVADDGFSLQVRPLMTMTLSVDHRIVYGQEAAEFLGAIKSWLENPHALQM